MKRLTLKGKRFGRLVAKDWRTRNKKVEWFCRCDCGEQRWVAASKLTLGKTVSCGCYRREQSARRCAERVAHGMCKTATYRSWSNMHDRCRNKNNHAYEHYGARGITVCKRWMEFKNFYEDMGDKPKHKSLDRKNNNRGYSKRNCRWATAKEQSLNRRCSLVYSHDRKIDSTRGWAKTFGISVQALSYYIKHHGWTAAVVHYTKP